MSNLSKDWQRFTCRDCKDFYDCSLAGVSIDIPCEYFVKKYDRVKEARVVGDLITEAMRYRYNKNNNNQNL